MGKIGEATMAPNGLTATQWLLIAFFILLAAVIAFEVMQDLAVNQRSTRPARRNGKKMTGALAKALPALQATLEAAGIEFLDGDEPGVKLRARKGKAKVR